MKLVVYISNTLDEKYEGLRLEYYISSSKLWKVYQLG
jgi:hypothetical protein